MKHEDRILDGCLEEALGKAAPPDLRDRVRAELDAPAARAMRPGERPVVSAAERPPILRRAWPWLGAAAAAALLLWAGGVFSSPPRVELEARVLRGELSWTSDGERMRAAAGEQVRLSLHEGMRLHSGTVPLALQLPRFGTLFTETDTTLEVETMDITQRKGALAVGGVTLVVLAGAVTFNALARTEEAETGESVRLETADPQPAGMTARERQLADENEQLRQRLAEAQAQAARTRMADEEVEEPVAGDDAVAGETGDLEVRFSDDKYRDALAGVDWDVVGNAMKGQVAISAELAAALLADGEIPLELAGELQQFNGQLVGQLQPLMEGEVPGTGPNGTFTHPLVAANQVDQVLAAGDVPLSQDQSDRIAAIADHYLAQDENLRVTADSSGFFLETLLEETAMKDRFYAEVEQVLSGEQLGMIYPEGVKDYNQLNLFGPGVVWAQVAKPAFVSGPDDLSRRNFSRFSDGLQLSNDQQERLRPLLDNWSNSFPPDYWSETANAIERQGLMKTSRTRIAGERQLALFRSMLNGLGLTADQREKLMQNSGVMVPMVR